MGYSPTGNIQQNRGNATFLHCHRLMFKCRFNNGCSTHSKYAHPRGTSAPDPPPKPLLPERCPRGLASHTRIVHGFPRGRESRRPRLSNQRSGQRPTASWAPLYGRRDTQRPRDKQCRPQVGSLMQRFIRQVTDMGQQGGAKSIHLLIQRGSRVPTVPSMRVDSWLLNAGITQLSTTRLTIEHEAD